MVLDGHSYLTELDHELRKIIADSRGHREETLVDEIKGRLSWVAGATSVGR